jgi:hypothetical protein
MKSFSVFGVIVFALVAIAHLLRVIFQVEVIIGGRQISMWTSVAGFIIAAALAIGIWREVKEQ